MCHPFKLLLTCVSCLVSVSVVYSECMQSSFESARFRLCSDRCLLSVTVRDCIDPSTVPEDTKSVNIRGEIKVLRRGAFHNLSELYSITALPSNLTRINPGAFLDLPKLETVELKFNNLEEILWGVFSNSSIKDLDLSWNIISYIENQAFSYMPNLKFINLLRNNLNEFKKNWLIGSTALERLLLSYNNIKSIDSFAFDVFPNLTYCDLSFNKIKEIGAGAFDNVRHLTLIDLASNTLSWIQPNIFKSDIEVDELRLSLNRLSFLSDKLLENGKVKALFLHPNPWQCPCLQDILRWMGDHNVTLRNTIDDFRIRFNPDYPECSINPKHPKKCVIGYDDAFLETQDQFFKAVNYSASVWEKPTSERPNFSILQVAKPLSEDLSRPYK